MNHVSVTRPGAWSSPSTVCRRFILWSIWGALERQMSRLLAAALGAVPMGQRSVTPLALRATRALQDLSNEQVRDPKNWYQGSYLKHAFSGENILVAGSVHCFGSVFWRLLKWYLSSFWGELDTFPSIVFSMWTWERFFHTASFTVPLLKLTWPLKVDGWKMNFLLGRPIFRGQVSFREGTGIEIYKVKKQIQRQHAMRFKKKNWFPQGLLLFKFLIYTTISYKYSSRMGNFCQPYFWCQGRVIMFELQIYPQEWSDKTILWHLGVDAGMVSLQYWKKMLNVSKIREFKILNHHLLFFGKGLYTIYFFSWLPPPNPPFS